MSKLPNFHIFLLVGCAWGVTMTVSDPVSTTSMSRCLSHDISYDSTEIIAACGSPGYCGFGLWWQTTEESTLVYFEVADGHVLVDIPCDLTLGDDYRVKAFCYLTPTIYDFSEVVLLKATCRNK